jgi:murein L,D-transpeptidase YafK
VLADGDLKSYGMKRLAILLSVLALVILAVIFRPYVRAALSPMIQKFSKTRTVAERVQQYGEAARARIRPSFQRAQVAYPPKRVTLVGLKAERVLQVYAAGATNGYRFVRSYPILAASGLPGPKLRQGDGQVPEGVYAIESLNPNSRFHLSSRVGYPNAFDRAQAQREGRSNLGGDIMIHGSSVSVGCLAMGDEAAEDLFILAADTGLQNMTAILAPVDFRAGAAVSKAAKLPDWSGTLYAEIKTRLADLPLAKTE